MDTDKNEMNDENTNEKFNKCMLEFLDDVLKTFPEYTEQLKPYFDAIKNNNVEKCNELFEHCKTTYLPQFFNIIYENEELYADIDFYCFPNINFKDIYNSNISDNTKKVLWKYLQLVLFSCVNNTETNDMFGESTKLFEAIDSNMLHEKLMETVNLLNEKFGENIDDDDNGDDADDTDDVDDNDDDDKDANGNKTNKKRNPFFDADELNKHLESIMEGKIGNLAKEIATDAMEDMKNSGINLEDPKEMMNSMFKNPTKIFGLMKNIGGKIDEKIKDGSINESELVSEASEIMNKFEDIPGLKNMMNSMGLGKGKGKMDVKGMMNKMQTHMKQAKMRERMLHKLNERKKQTPEQFRAMKEPENVILEQTDVENNIFVFKPNDKEEIKKSSKKGKNKKKGKKK